ncbi:MAG: hypothetical protein DRI57_20630 [Deltaproteobacteria bacterium]|nr:MAG: hypothetical protein DRI57_20630 [Deltaproteobacteria bacterium]
MTADFRIERISVSFSDPLAIYFQVSAYEEQLFHCDPRMNADERGRPVCRGLIRGLCKLFSQEKIPKNFWPATYSRFRNDSP